MQGSIRDTDAWWHSKIVSRWDQYTYQWYRTEPRNWRSGRADCRLDLRWKCRRGSAIDATRRSCAPSSGGSRCPRRNRRTWTWCTSDSLPELVETPHLRLRRIETRNEKHQLTIGTEMKSLQSSYVRKELVWYTHRWVGGGGNRGRRRRGGTPKPSFWGIGSGVVPMEWNGERCMHVPHL
jgi:hypothetical protein